MRAELGWRGREAAMQELQSSVSKGHDWEAGRRQLRGEEGVVLLGRMSITEAGLAGWLGGGWRSGC